MAIINETELLDVLKKSKNVLLLEPPYKRQYIPLGLAKLSTYIKMNGGHTSYSRTPVDNKNFDLILMATCFTNDADIVLKSINSIKRGFFNNNTRMIVGGIFASLKPNYIMSRAFGEIDIFLNTSDILDNCLPDYSINYKVPGFFNKCATLFTTRGCVNKCAYCMVWRMEPKFHILPGWKRNIRDIDREVFLVSDNNLLASPSEHVEDVVLTLNKYNKKVVFNNGLDANLITAENAKLLASLTYVRNGFRTAFDRMDYDGIYQTAMETLINAGLKISESYTYILFNFDDTPQDAYYRVHEARRYKSNPYAIKYRPLNHTSRKLDHVGKYWTKNLLKAFTNYNILFGYNRGDKTFESWVKNDERIKLTSDDWDKWYYKK